mmetsp:Transcript_5263/g.15578  ORF Transcript_5263/g.15578 Transcript_5263/m.15578 type:complete len:318 (+) Transcript_5263:505-1458(+)
MEEVNLVFCPRNRTRGEAGAAKVVGVHAQGLRDDVPPEVPVGPEAEELLDLEEPVVLELAVEAQELQHGRDVLQVPPVHEVDPVVADALDVVHDVLAELVVHREVVDVADSKARLLAHAHGGAGLVGDDAVVLPVVHTDEVVHGRHGLQSELGGDELNALVDEPGDDPGHGEGLPAADHVDLFHAVLHARAHVLNGKGAAANDGNVVLAAPFVVVLAADAVHDVAVEELLPLVDHPLRVRQVAGEEAHARGQERARGGARTRGAVDGELVVLLPVVLPDDVHLGHVRLQPHVGVQAVLLGDRLEVINELVARGPAVL